MGALGSRGEERRRTGMKGRGALAIPRLGLRSPQGQEGGLQLPTFLKEPHIPPRSNLEEVPALPKPFNHRGSPPLPFPQLQRTGAAVVGCAA